MIILYICSPLQGLYLAISKCCQCPEINDLILTVKRIHVCDRYAEMTHFVNHTTTKSKSKYSILNIDPVGKTDFKFKMCEQFVYVTMYFIIVSVFFAFLSSLFSVSDLGFFRYFVITIADITILQRIGSTRIINNNNIYVLICMASGPRRLN